jgi:hypothetical protein
MSETTLFFQQADFLTGSETKITWFDKFIAFLWLFCMVFFGAGFVLGTQNTSTYANYQAGLMNNPAADMVSRTFEKVKKFIFNDAVEAQAFFGALVSLLVPSLTKIVAPYLLLSGHYLTLPIGL